MTFLIFILFAFHAKNKMTENTTFFVFSFFKVDPIWRWLPDLEKQEAGQQLDAELKNNEILYRIYSTIGIRSDADFLIWIADKSLEKIQNVFSKIYKTPLGKYISTSHVYVSATRPSIYSKEPKGHGWMANDEQKKFVIVYPFIKTREWYLLPPEQRQEMMDEHIEVGRKYPQILLNTTYSFGIGDQDFMLAFETDDLGAFQNLIMDLRKTKVSKYVTVDTPMIVCIKKDVLSMVQGLG